MRAQIRIGETIAVMIIFFFLLIFGAIFYVNFQQTKVYEKRSEVIVQESIRVSQIVSNLPELQCTSQNVIDDNCLDIYKVLRVKKDVFEGAPDFYYPLLLFSKVTIKEFYPQNRSWVIYEPPTPHQNPIRTYIPITLYNTTAKTYAFGRLQVDYFPYYEK